MTNEGTKLSDKGCEELLVLARKTLENYLANGKVLDYRTSEPELLGYAGAFVSLHREDELRGCIGQLVSDTELYRTIQHCAICAAMEDTRFHPVTLEELGELEIEISVLTPFRRVTNFEEIEVGRHGLYIVCGSQRGLLLPQVASQYGWDRITFLAQTCRKAGLPADAWREPSAEIQVFEAQVFSE